jgi:hypothetical protein
MTDDTYKQGTYRQREQEPPKPEPIADGVVSRFEHVLEVDPTLMRRFPQQDQPVWETKRIVDSRWEHLRWMHDHFADEVLVAGEESETGAE